MIGRTVFIKREDRSALHYAGNKIRPLEMVFGAAKRAGRQAVWATGAYGSNHALATLIHAPRVGLGTGALLWPQPPSDTARDNLLASLSSGEEIVFCRSIATFPARAWWLSTSRPRAWVMPPGAATPIGALGHAGAAIELCHQLRQHRVESPARIVLPVGSTCTTAGLIVGSFLARELGVGMTTLPDIHAVRVTPWPVTSPVRIAQLAVRTASLLRASGGPELNLTLRSALARLTVHGRYIGAGYGRPTRDGLAATRDFEPHGPWLDSTYSAKAAACLIDHLPQWRGPTIWWSTKSSIELPALDERRVSQAPQRVRRWLQS